MIEIDRKSQFISTFLIEFNFYDLLFNFSNFLKLLIDSFDILIDFFDLLIKNGSILIENRLIFIKKRSIRYVMIQYRRWILNQTKINIQIWKAWNPNYQLLDLETPNRLSLLV